MCQDHNIWKPQAWWFLEEARVYIYESHEHEDPRGVGLAACMSILSVSCVAVEMSALFLVFPTLRKTRVTVE